MTSVVEQNESVLKVKVKKPRAPRKPRVAKATAGETTKEVKPKKARGKAAAVAVPSSDEKVSKAQRKPRTKKAKEVAAAEVVAAVEGSAVQAVTRDILTLLDKGEWSKADRRSLITNPKTGWTIFLNEQRVLNPLKRLCDISKEMASVWQAMSDEQKTPYNEKSKLDHQRYEDQFNALSSDEKKLLRKIKSQTKRERKEKSEKLGKVLSAFMLYSADKRKFVLDSNPDAKVTKVASIIGKMWKSESDAVRAEYHARREEMKTNVLKESADAEAAAAAAEISEAVAADILLDKPVGFGHSVHSASLVGVNA